MSVNCDRCGRQAEESAALAWASSVERGRRRRYCETCSREHVRSMEAKLDEEHW